MNLFTRIVCLSLLLTALATLFLHVPVGEESASAKVETVTVAN